MFFSSETNGFYDFLVHGSKIPKDAVEISYKKYCELILLQSSGYFIIGDSNGHPIAIKNDEKLIAPHYVSRAQGKAALIRAGLWQGVVDFVNSISDPVEKAVAEVALNDTTNWQRTSQFLNESASALGLTDEQLDSLFLQASKIEL